MNEIGLNGRKLKPTPEGCVRYRTRTGTRIERRTKRGNKGNEKFQELARLEEEWKKNHEKTDN